MLLTIFLTLVFCVAITLMMLSAVAFIQDRKMFSSAPKEAQEAIIPRDKEPIAEVVNYIPCSVSICSMGV